MQNNTNINDLHQADENEAQDKEQAVNEEWEKTQEKSSGNSSSW